MICQKRKKKIAKKNLHSVGCFHKIVSENDFSGTLRTFFYPCCQKAGIHACLHLNNQRETTITEKLNLVADGVALSSLSNGG